MCNARATRVPPNPRGESRNRVETARPGERAITGDAVVSGGGTIKKEIHQAVLARPEGKVSGAARGGRRDEDAPCR